MYGKPNVKRGRSLDDLPESKNEFWDGEVFRVELSEPKVDFFEQPHYFNRASGHQAYCDHCSYGFELDPGDKVENGHLYTKEGKKVI